MDNIAVLNVILVNLVKYGIIALCNQELSIGRESSISTGQGIWRLSRNKKSALAF